MKSNFKFPMLKAERILGCVYLLVHIFLLPTVFSYTNALQYMNIRLDSAHVNLIYYVIGFLFVLIFLFRYLKASFSDLLDNLLGSLKAVVLAYLINSLFITLVSVILSFFLKDAANPNTQEIIRQTKLNADVWIFIAVLLAPIVEETLFRGTLFGMLRNKNRIWAYVISTLVFALYHLWQFFIVGFDWTILLYLLQYIPASLALCWCYEMSGSIWAPIVLHAAINLISIQVTIG